MVKVGDKVSYQGGDAFVVSTNEGNDTVNLFKDGKQIENVKSFELAQQGEVATRRSEVESKNLAQQVDNDKPIGNKIQDLSKQTQSSEAAAMNSSRQVSDMSSAQPGSQRNTNQADTSDMNNDKMPAPGTGDSGAGLASDGRGKQHLDAEIVDKTSGNPDEGRAGGTTGDNTPRTRAIGSTGTRALSQAAGIPKDIRDKMNEPVWVRRLHGTEEVLVQANRASVAIIDRNGRRLEVGGVVNLPVRIIGMNDADNIEVVYPPFIPTVEEVPTIDAGQLKNGDGSNYTGSTYKISENNEVVNAQTNEPPNMDEMPRQERLTVAAARLERF